MKRLISLLFALGLLCSCQPGGIISFGIISDVHQDIMHDGEARLARFIDDANMQETDFIIQLGDFCRPYDYNKSFLSLFNNHEGPEYHVIGNHEMDGGFSKDSVISFFGMESAYYSFDQKDFHFIVLDGNDKNPSPDAAPGYSRYIGERQLAWLRKDLESTDKQCVIFSHQALRGEYAVENAMKIRDLLEGANQAGAKQKVIACFNGHNHADSVFRINDIYYIEINSASYEWLGGDYQHESYSKETHEEFPYIAYTAPYEKPLWAIVEISKNTITIKGREGKWKGKSPQEVGYPGRSDGLNREAGLAARYLSFRNSVFGLISCLLVIG